MTGPRIDVLKPADLDWSEDGTPVSAAFGDVYFSREDGLAETRAVFLQGCGLPGAWANRRRFTVAELGFGTGLNVLALLDLWRRTRPEGGHLHVFSIEAHPLRRDAAERAHAAWPELADLSRRLRSRWPALLPGQHRIDLPELNATLDLAFGDAGAMLAEWSGRADAWFLDGFAPSANPSMWSQEVLALVAARSAPGARVATFTVAGQVRRSLAASGFTVDKKPGHGRKRERLEAVLPGLAADPPAPERIVIVGAGIAGSSLARAFRAIGRTVTVIEAEGPGSGASGAPAALVTPWVDAGLGPAAVLAARAFRRASDLYRAEVPQAVIDTGVVRMPKDARDHDRLLAVADQPVWTDGSIAPIAAAEVAGLTGEPRGAPAFWLGEALVIEPPTILDAWLAHATLIAGKVVSITPGSPASIRLEDGRAIQADAVVVASGWGSHDLGLEAFRPVRGQVAWAAGIRPGRAAVWGPGYVAPTRDGVLLGATHDGGRADGAVDPADNGRLVERLAGRRPALAARLAGASLKARAAVRATTPDHRPVCGRLGEGVFVLSGLGGRGFSWAPLLAEHLAAIICAEPSPLSCVLVSQLEPGRLTAAKSKPRPDGAPESPS